MIRALPNNPAWSRPEQLWICFVIAVVMHLALLGVNGLRTQQQHLAPTLPLESLVDTATEGKPDDAQAGLVDRAASGNEQAGAQVASGLEAEGGTEAEQALSQGLPAPQSELAGADGLSVLLQRSSPLKVFYSQSAEPFIGDAQRTFLAASAAAAGDSGQDEQTQLQTPSRLLSMGPASKEDGALQYVEGWRRWMRANGNQFYPAEARRLGLRGDVLTQVRLNRDGSLADVRILQSSGERLLDQAVLQTTREARWYLPFPSELAGQYDQLEFSWRWRYGAAR